MHSLSVCQDPHKLHSGLAPSVDSAPQTRQCAGEHPRSLIRDRVCPGIEAEAEDVSPRKELPTLVLAARLPEVFQDPPPSAVATPPVAGEVEEVLGPMSASSSPGCC